MKKSWFFALLIVAVGIIPRPAKGWIMPQEIYIYTIRKGDTWRKIIPATAENFKKIKKFVEDVNRIDSRHLIVGMKIRLPRNPNELPFFCPVPEKISAAQDTPRAVYVFLGQQYFGAYSYGHLIFWGPISSGKDWAHRTPTGQFHVLLKDKNHVSTDPECPGAPMPYALQFTSSGDFLHQQALPGRAASHGCVRLLMSDARKLFYWARVGDPVSVLN